MIDSAPEFNQLLNARQVEDLLKSVIKIAPYLFLIVDMEDNVLAQAIPADIPADLLDELYKSIKVDTLANEVKGRPYTEIRMPIDARGHLVGYIIGISFNQAERDSHTLSLITQIISQVLTEQADKEYELNSLSLELLSRYEEITLLYELGQSLGSVFDVPTICNIALQMALQVIPAKNAYIALIDEKSEYLEVVASQGDRGFIGWRVPMGQGISGYVAASGKQILLDAQETSPLGITRKLRSDPVERLEPPEPILAIPLVLPVDHIPDHRGILGVMTMTGRPTGKMFTAGDAKLMTSIATQVSIAIHNSQLVHALREAERVQQQVKIAADIQQSLLPKQSPQVPGVELFGQCVSAANMGGDYYDFFVDEAGRLTLLIADVSGHSIGTALMMATARSALRLEIALGKPLPTVMADTNQTMFADLSQAEMFISAFCARYDPRTRTLTFVNAGHNPPLLRRGQNGEVLELDTDGLIFGVLDETDYEEQSVVLDPGDILTLYTDGAIEARNGNGTQYGEDRLRRLLSRYSSLRPSEITRCIYESIYQYTGPSPQQDDITLLLLKICPENP